MIDTNKYEGHTPAPWMNLGSDANSLLMQDAPLLLEEVKRLREAIEKMAIGMDEDWRHWQIELLKLIGKDWKVIEDVDISN